MRASQGLLRAVVTARVADSVQYWESACEYFNYASLDLRALRSLFQVFETSNTEWLAELTRRKEIDHMPCAVAEYFGVKISGDVALTLVIRSLVHYLRKTFEALAQFVNAAALADSGLDPEHQHVNIRSVLTELKSEGGFTSLAVELNKVVTTGDYYQYLADLDNTLKHLVAVEPHVRWFILENRLEAALPSFTKADKRFGPRSYIQKPLLTTAQELVAFAESILNNVDRIVSTECGIVWHPLTQSRQQDLLAYHQFADQEGKVPSGQIQFLQVAATPLRGDVLRAMIVVETEADGVYQYEFINCHSNKIVLCDTNRVPIGVMEAIQPMSPNDEVQIKVYQDYRVIEVGPVSQFTLHKILVETNYARGRSAGVTWGASAGSFPAGLLTGELPAILVIHQEQGR